ncbi:MAG: sodium:solute symporter [Saprospiraceae bacterium]|nr:sodium:solute symporter [Saprospiraceae bacterium]
MRQKTENTEDYFLAGRNVGWFVVGSSIFASNIGSEHVVGLAGTGAAGKFPLIIYELHAWIVLILGWVFLPFYMRSGVFTMPEFLERRFDSRSRAILSVVSLVGYVLTKVSVTIYAGGIVVSSLLGIEFWTGALATVILTGIYTVLGGMRAVVYTEAMQTVVLVGGAATLTFLGLDAAGGWHGLREQLGPAFFNMWRPYDDPEFPWPSLFVTSSIVGVWYWCTDQYIVQRALAARNLTEGRRGTIFGAFLKLLPVFLFLIPGVVALALKEKGVLQWERSDEAFATLMATILPSGLRGLVAAGLLAALMSSLASVFNSCSTLFTIDIYKKKYPHASERQLVQVGRLATIAVVGAGIIWIPIMSNISGVLYEYLQSIQTYLSPPVAVVFLLGIFLPRVNRQGAFATLIAGFTLAAVRIFLEIYAKSGLLAEGSLLHTFGSINFLHFGVLSLVFCLATAILVSLWYPAPPPSQLEGLTFAQRSKEAAVAHPGYTWIDIAASVMIIILVAFVMVYFSA